MPTNSEKKPARQEQLIAAIRIRLARWITQCIQLSSSVLARWAAPEAAFLRLGWLFGLLFLVVTPLFQVPDEIQHFYRAYEISEGDIFPYKTPDGQVGEELPRSIPLNTNETAGNIPFHPEEKFSLDKFMARLPRPLNQQDRMLVIFPATATAPPVAYLPQAVGIALGRLFDLSPLLLAYAGRLASLCVGLLLTYLAIRIIPLMKWGMVLLALTPMSVYERSSLAVDGLANGLAFVLIALVLHAALDEGEPLRRWQVVLLGLVAMLLCLCKTHYFPLLLLCLLIPRARFGGTRQYVTAMLGIFLFASLPLIAWMAAVRDLQSPIAGAPNLANMPSGTTQSMVATEQVRFLLHDHLQLARLFYHTFEMRGLFYLKSFIGVLGWLDTYLPASLIAAYTGALILVALADSHYPRSLEWRNKLWILAIFALNFGLISLLIYLLWTPLRAYFIEGIQGRYFIPLAPLLLLLLSQRRWRIDLSGRRLHWLLIAFVLVTLTVTLRSLIWRYYLPALP